LNEKRKARSFLLALESGGSASGRGVAGVSIKMNVNVTTKFANPPFYRRTRQQKPCQPRFFSFLTLADFSFKDLKSKKKLAYLMKKEW
jgi:hypothetical protein